MVHPGGSPRTVSLSKNEMISLGKEMVEWVKENEPIHIKQWYSLQKRFTYNEWKSFIQLPEFLPYYQEALSIVSLKYIDGTINPSIAQRFLRVYFKDVKEEENQELEHKVDKETESKKQVLDHQAKIAKDSVSGIDVHTVQALESFMKFISQSQLPSRNIADNSINADNKS